MNVGQFSALISQFAKNWRANSRDFAISVTGQDIEVAESHPLYALLVSLCSGRATSLPFFANNDEIVWCTIAPDGDSLREAVASLHAWVLPSFGGERSGEGYVQPATSSGTLASAIISVSPSGYYKWRCPRAFLTRVCAKLRLRHGLEEIRPTRNRPSRPSLYELRARFCGVLLVGDRDGAEEIVELLDSLQLETAINTQFMRIRMWHHFRENDRIREHPDLHHLLVQPLPPLVRSWIDEALDIQNEPSFDVTVSAEIDAGFSTPPPENPTWVDWFRFLKNGEKGPADLFLHEHTEETSLNFSTRFIDLLAECLDELVMDDQMRTRERGMILQGVSQLLNEYVREPQFPRAELGGLYLSFLRLWCVLYKGNTVGREHGHILLEIGNALLRLNLNSEEVCQTLEEWWRAKPARSQLYFALDAMELLEREMPGTESSANLWIEAADVIKRGRSDLPLSDREIWRNAGKRLGIESSAIAEYLPTEDTTTEDVDILAKAGISHVAIVCLREEQASDAAKMILERGQFHVTLVTSTVAGSETTQACQADVVLFVWMSSTHAVFRAFDGFDRRRLCYVQGTGASSIVRSLERWILTR